MVRIRFEILTLLHSSRYALCAFTTTSIEIKEQSCDFYRILYVHVLITRDHHNNFLMTVCTDSNYQGLI